MLSKCKEYFFIWVMTSRTSYLLLFMLIKKKGSKREIFSQTKPRAFSRAFHFETHKNRKSPHDILSLKTILPNTRANNLFPKEKNRVARIQEQIVSKLHQNNFCFQNARSRFQDSFWTYILSPNWKGEKWENDHLKPLFFWVVDRTHLEAMTSTRGQHYV